MEFCERLKKLRKQANLTQSDFAEKTGVHFQTVSKWERGAFFPDIGMLGIISNVLGVTLETLFELEECETPIQGEFEVNALANAISDYRKALGYSQSELAEKLNTNADNVSKWERAVTVPDMQTLLTLSQVYQIPFSHLYYGIKREDKTEKPTFYHKSASRVPVVIMFALTVT